jgi:hypothetical protein
MGNSLILQGVPESIIHFTPEFVPWKFGILENASTLNMTGSFSWIWYEDAHMYGRWIKQKDNLCSSWDAL